MAVYTLMQFKWDKKQHLMNAIQARLEKYVREGRLSPSDESSLIKPPSLEGVRQNLYSLTQQRGIVDPAVRLLNQIKFFSDLRKSQKVSFYLVKFVSR